MNPIVIWSATDAVVTATGSRSDSTAYLRVGRGRLGTHRRRRAARAPLAASTTPRARSTSPALRRSTGSAPACGDRPAGRSPNERSRHSSCRHGSSRRSSPRRAIAAPAPLRWGTPDLATPVRAVTKSGSGGSTGRGLTDTDKDDLEGSRSNPGCDQRRQAQRATRRAGRVRPLEPSSAAQFSISRRSQSLTRPTPRSITGRGMSGYRRWYWLTVLRWESWRMSATP